LTVLRLGASDVRDLRPLAAHSTLRTLVIANNEGPVDVSPLADLEIALHVKTNKEVIGLDKLGPGVQLA
jgi:hypothetical protein